MMPRNAFNGKTRDLLVLLIGLSLGGGGGLMVRADESALEQQLEDLDNRMTSHLDFPSPHGELAELRELVLSEIDRAHRPIERELSQIREELRRVNQKLDEELRS